ncbi:YjbH domain-containing protein [uncultured Tateyamaria sp.]|uniref:YjbH domain-containing protein n=1 Tax=Tateyamaria sp. 1078 TaxID=3417464 RepID=UPI00261EC2DD|nr:YjbH domain-containing protein [uncultured Tateyamaria sp.]
MTDIARHWKWTKAVAAAAALITAPALSYAEDAAAPPSPTLNFYGVPGLIDMPSGEALPDGTLAFSVSSFGGQTRTNVTFQFSPRISGSFRYISLQDWNSDGFETYRDRSFDARFLLAREGRIRPAISVGLQDLAGTGIYAAEYVVATKNFDQPLSLPGRIKVTAGLGWGRLGQLGDIGAPFSGSRPAFDPNDNGGSPSTDQWFRGPAAPFGGIEWQVNDKFGVKLEYSSDAYAPETSRDVFERSSRINIGAEYQVSRFLRVGGYYLYGEELGVSAQLVTNPKAPPRAFTLAGPRPVITRPDRAAAPEAYSTGWAPAKGKVTEQLGPVIEPLLREDGIRLESLTLLSTARVEARVSSQRYTNNAIAIGRTARLLTATMPATVDTFDIILMQGSIPVTRVSLSRSDLEQLEFQPGAADLLLARTALDSAPSDTAPDTYVPEGLYPRFSWAIGPFVRPSFFDVEEPVRVDAGIALTGEFRPAPGWLIAGELRHRLVGNVEDTATSPSKLPAVRTSAPLFAQEGDTTIETLYVNRQWKAGKNTYARLTAGYLEQMFGGVSGELLWQPTDSRLALGVEANYARQRDFDQQFGFQDYDIFTGHVSAYYDFGGGYVGQVDVGRYLAGDYGATFSVDRTFKNGWSVGGFFTLTDATSEEFGEGSFDKGIRISIPLQWLTGQPTTQSATFPIRPIQRDGGARLSVPNRLYPQLRDADARALREDWGRVWE